MKRKKEGEESSDGEHQEEQKNETDADDVNIPNKEETQVTSHNYCMIFEGHPIINADYVEHESIRVVVASFLDGEDKQTLSVEFPAILN